MARFEEKKIVLTQNQTYLQMADNRLRGLRINNAGNAEIGRMEAAREDILSRMDEEEQAGYIAATTVKLTPAEEKARMAAEMKAMEANRDKPSI